MRRSNKNRSEVIIDTITPNQIIHDYLYTLTSSSLTVAKRIRQLSFICGLLGRNVDELISHLNISVVRSHITN